MREVPSQHGGVHPGQGVQPQEPSHHPPSGQADLGPPHVRSQPAQGPRHGAADPEPAGPQGVRLQGRGRVSRVSNTLNPTTIYPVCLQGNLSNS